MNTCRVGAVGFLAERLTRPGAGLLDELLHVESALALNFGNRHHSGLGRAVESLVWWLRVHTREGCDVVVPARCGEGELFKTL